MNLSGWGVPLAFSDLVRRFGAKRERVLHQCQDGRVVCLHGISCRETKVNDNLATSFSRDGDGQPHLGILHCNVGDDPNHGTYASCSRQNLENGRMDYWALGHEHIQRVLRESRPSFAPTPAARHGGARSRDSAANGEPELQTATAAIPHSRCGTTTG